MIGMLSSEEVEEEGQDNADDNTGGEGEEKTEIIPLNGNIPRKLTDPGDFWSCSHYDSDENEDDAYSDEHLSHQCTSGNCFIVVFLLLCVVFNHRYQRNTSSFN